MNTGQSFLSLGAMLLVSLIILRVNSEFLNTSNVLLDSKIGVLAISLGSSIIEEANGKAFDAATVTDAVSDLTELTSPNSLGHNASETYPSFNDFDDYDGLEITANKMASAEFKIIAKVNYINPNDPNNASNNRTWHKKISVFVTSPSMINGQGRQDTVKLSSVFSYWHFR